MMAVEQVPCRCYHVSETSFSWAVIEVFPCRLLVRFGLKGVAVVLIDALNDRMYRSLALLAQEAAYFFYYYSDPEAEVVCWVEQMAVTLAV